MDPQEAGAQIEAYQQANADILSQDRMAIGGWNDGKGNVVIEPSVNVADRQEATDLGEANNQESVHDNVTREDIPTGGTGEYTGMSVDPVMATMSMALDLLIKGFGDPNSTQDREPNGQFGEGSGASAESERSASDSKLEEVAIDNFGAAVEMQGQQFVTPNGTILDLPQGDGHDSIVQVTGGSVNTATSRAIDAGFARTSLDIANSSGELGLVMEFSRPLTDPQIGAVITAAKDNELSYFAIDVPPITSGGYDRARGLSDSTLLYSGEKESPTLSGIAGMIRDANVAAGGTRKSAAYIKMLLKSFGDAGNSQERVGHGEFGTGGGGALGAEVREQESHITEEMHNAIPGGSAAFDLKGGLTQQQVTSAQGRLEKAGFTFMPGTTISPEIQANIASHATNMSPEQIQAAVDAYQTYHDISVAAITSTTPEAACCMVAVCSQNNSMGPTTTGASPTIDMAVQIANACAADPTVTLTPEMAAALAPAGETTINDQGQANRDLAYAFPAMDANGRSVLDQQMEPGTYKLSELSPMAAGRIIGAGLGTPSAQAVELWRGASPNEVITSPKLRNFASNITVPSNPNAITCDRWVARYTLTPQMTAAAAETFRMSSNGAYSVIADNIAYYAGHNSLGPNGSTIELIPNQAQAVPWIHDAQPNLEATFSKYDSLISKSMQISKRHRISGFPLTWFDNPGPGELTPEQVAADQALEEKLRPLINAVNPELASTLTAS
jgi:hypothetical protein